MPGIEAVFPRSVTDLLGEQHAVYVLGMLTVPWGMGQEKRKSPHTAEIRVRSEAQGGPEEECQSSHPDRFSKGCLEEVAAELDFEGKGVAWRMRSEGWGLGFGLGLRLVQVPLTVGLYRVLEVLAGLRDQERCLSRGEGTAEPACG